MIKTISISIGEKYIILLSVNSDSICFSGLLPGDIQFDIWTNEGHSTVHFYFVLFFLHSFYIDWIHLLNADVIVG